jgi:hypothetical protein
MAKFLIIDSVDRIAGAVENFKINLLNPIKNVKRVELVNISYTQNPTMTPFLNIRIDVCHQNVLTTDEIRSSFVIPNNQPYVYQANQHITKADQKVFSSFRVEILNHDMTVPIMSEYIMILKLT